MDLQNTLKAYIRQLENQPCTLEVVVYVCRRIMATLYDAYFPALMIPVPFIIRWTMLDFSTRVQT